jgi:predicted permease
MTRIPGLKRFVRIGDTRRVDLGSIDDEIRFHLDTRIDELVAAGHSRAEAERAATNEFCDVGRYRADCMSIDSRTAREVRMREFFESVIADLRHAARSLGSQPGFAIVAVTTLALGIGATTSVFSAVDGALLRPLPYTNADRIVHVGEQPTTKPGRGSTTSFENYDDWRKRSTSFAAIGIVTNASPTLTGHGEASRVPLALVSSGMFDVFGIRMHLGRPIADADNQPGASPVTVVTYEFWQSRFGGDPAIVGKSISLNAVPVQIIGVMPKGFSGPGRLDRALWRNFIPSASDGRAGRSKEVYALLRRGVSGDGAQREMTRIAADLAAAYPNDNKDETVIVDPLTERAVADVERPLYMLLGASLFVLLIACANLSNLLLARGTSRSREIAVRSALGAGRGRIARQLLTESLLLAAFGAVVGVAMAAAAIRTLVVVGPALFATRPPELSPLVLAVSIAISCATVLLFGLLPALRISPRDPQTALRNASARVVGTRGSLRTALAIAQLSLAVVLLSSSTLVIKSFVRVLEVDAGIRRENLLTMSLTLPFAKYDSLKSTTFYQQLASRARQLPGVKDVAFTSLIPFGGSFDRVGISQIAGEPERIGASLAVADRYVVSGSYFETMGIRLVRGRLIDPSDRIDAPTICVVDAVFAQRTFAGQNAIGRQVKIPGPARKDLATIVGIVTHVKTYGLDVESPGQIYLSNEQFPWRWSSMVVRVSDDPKRVAPAITRLVHDLDADQPVSDVTTMNELMAELLRGRRFILILLSSFAVVAVMLAAIGLYGVIAYGVSQRRRELGVRLALGAQRSHIARMVVAEGSRIAMVGAVLGTLTSAATGRFLSSFLFEVQPLDAAVYSIVVAGLIGVAMIACLVPAHRATTVDAAEVLRGE